jgi:phage baseplate assembly protein V
MTTARIGEIERRLSNVVRPGTVLEADYEKARIRVALGRNKTAWLPWMTSRAGNDRTWHAPEVGEQVLVISPSGELSQGYVMPGGIYKNDFPANGDSETVSRTTYGDGAVIEYDREAHAYAATIPAGGSATVAVGDNSKVLVEDSDVTLSFGSGSGGALIQVESGKITLSVGGNSIILSSSGIATSGDITQTGKITASGDLITSGKVTATADVKAGTISLMTHVHAGVMSGTSSTAVPTP